MAKLSVSIAGAKGRKIRFYVLETDADATVAQVQAIPAVARSSPYIEPELHNDVARVVLGIDAAAGGPVAGLAETGAGQVVAVADTGLDDTHPDFRRADRPPDRAGPAW